MAKKTIGFMYDLKTDMPLRDGDPADLNAEFDSQDTVNFVKGAIEAAGHTVVCIGSLKNLLNQLPLSNIDIVFNICEGFGSRNREAQAPIILESLGIPCIGSDGLTMSLALDKIMTKKVLIADGIPTPRYIGISSRQDLLNFDHMQFPMIVKLRHEGSSKGLEKSSVVHSVEQLRSRAECLLQRYHNAPLLVEELIVGWEFTVPVVGNDPAEALPPVQVIIGNKLDVEEMIYTFEDIVATDLCYECPAKIDAELERAIKDVALRTYRAVDCKDFGRVDIRVDKHGKPFVLEINPLPSLARDDVFMYVPQRDGYDYNTTIAKIIDSGLRRYGLK